MLILRLRGLELENADFEAAGALNSRVQILRLWGFEVENADFEAARASDRECRF